LVPEDAWTRRNCSCFPLKANYRAMVGRWYINQLMTRKTSDGMPYISQQRIPGYVPVQNALLSGIAFRKTKSGQSIGIVGPVYVHPAVVRPINSLLEDPIGGNRIVKAISAINAILKQSALFFSGFHAFSLTESAWSGNLGTSWNPLKGVIATRLELRRFGIDPTDTFLNQGVFGVVNRWTGYRMPIIPAHHIGIALAHSEDSPFNVGLFVGRSLEVGGVGGAAALDRQVGGVDIFLEELANILTKLGLPNKLNVALGIREIKGALDRQLWDRWHNGLKLYTAANLMMTDLIESNRRVIDRHEKPRVQGAEAWAEEHRRPA